jgi:VWFA-related protein
MRSLDDQAFVRSGRILLAASVTLLTTNFLFSASTAAKTPQQPSEVSASDAQPIVRLRVPVVPVRVVVRNSNGSIADNLTKDDFEIRDNKKVQDITNFAVEHPTSHKLPDLFASQQQHKQADTVESPGFITPEQFVLIILDDIHVRESEALAVRVQTAKVLDSLNPATQVAILSTSGLLSQNSTNDRGELRQVINRFKPNPIALTSNSDCPHISYYQAHLMVALQDPDAIAAAVDNVWACKFDRNPQLYATAQQEAKQTAQSIDASGAPDIDAAIRCIDEGVKRLSAMPGQRSILLLSPGFASFDMVSRLNPILDRAIKANVVVNTVDVRGLYVPVAMGDASSGGSNPESATRFRSAEEAVAGDVLSDLAVSTGGVWFHNRNDLEAQVVQALELPSTSYVLTFSPANSNLDGKFHKITVTLRNPKGLTLQARNGYFAPKSESTPELQAETEFHDELFAQDEISDFPVDIHTRFFRKESNQASLSVIAHIDVRGMHFEKVNGHNFNEVTVAVLLFDDHGNFVNGLRRSLTLRLQDSTLRTIENTGMSVKIDFDVKPGNYIVRVVSRDSKDAKLAAHNGGVVIPGDTTSPGPPQ